MRDRNLGTALALFYVLIGPAAIAQPAADGEEEFNGGGSTAAIRPAVQPALPEVQPARNTVDWRGIVWQSAMFTGIQHAFRLGTEPGTRDGMKGPFFRGYAGSVADLHGWGDGDPFLVNYIGHPIQGSVSGFIYVQNDPQARMLAIGKDPRYWRSRMKAMGMAWVYSTWFEIGPASEASIGKIQSRRPQQGFVDHVVTPVVGTGWLIAEDFLDEKIIIPFERRFENRWARMMVRSWLNPTRSFSNALRFKTPWYRDSRGGITAPFQEPRRLETESPRYFPKTAPLELTVLPTWTKFEGTQCAGGGGQAAYRLSPSFRLVGQVSGCQLRDLPRYVSGDSLLYAVGPRWTPLAERRLNPYAQVLLGGSKLTRYEVDPIREALLKAQAKQARQEPPPAETYTKTETSHGLALLAGTGVDVRLNPAFAFRLASIEYARSWAPPFSGIENRSFSRGLQLSSGLILQLGTW